MKKPAFDDLVKSQVMFEETHRISQADLVGGLPGKHRQSEAG
jgi:hypothetical protein